MLLRAPPSRVQVDAPSTSVIVATEPLWATAFGVLLLGEVLQPNELIGGALVVAAPLVSLLEPTQLRQLLRLEDQQEGDASDC